MQHNYLIFIIQEKRERDTFFKKWLKEIETLEAMCNIDFDLLEEKKLKLEKLSREILQSHIIRSPAKWVEEGEKPRKYFCSLKSRNLFNKTINKCTN